MTNSEPSFYEQVGGRAFFDQLVERFYAGVATDPVLRPMYPDDLAAPKEHLALFLSQYWGGPTTYGEQRGHPRLRMRHAPFAIGEPQRQAWLRHMTAAIRSAELPEDLESRLVEYVTMAAAHMVNQP